MTSPSILRVTTTSDQKIYGYVGGILTEVIWPSHLPRPQKGDLWASDTPFSSAQNLRQIGQSSSQTLPPSSDALRWNTPLPDGKNRRKVLEDRAIIRRAVCNRMDTNGFLEIDIPLLVHGVIPDAALHSFAIEDRFLVTTTENQLKRMETGGFEKIYSLTKNFREGDTTSPYRNPEFTMLEWARVAEPYNKVEEDAEDIVWQAHKALGGTGQIIYQGHTIDLTPPWDRLTVKSAIHRITGYSLKDFTAPSLKEALNAANIPLRPTWEEDRNFLFSLLMDHVQQFLGFKKPVLLQEWPAYQTSMALETGDGETAHRSEVYVAGIELADGFPALTDPKRQKETFAQQMAQRAQEGLPPPAIDVNYLQALEDGLPQESSIAMGFDRLVMLLTDQPTIKTVLAFGWDEL